VSVIFDAMLVFGLSDRRGRADLNRRLYHADTERRQQFGEVDVDRAGAGGSKVFTTDVYAASFNHLTPSTVEECIVAAEWQYPETILYVRDLGDYHYDEDVSLSAQTVAQLREEVMT
jgi:hypothetical protein